MFPKPAEFCIRHLYEILYGHDSFCFFLISVLNRDKNITNAIQSFKKSAGKLTTTHAMPGCGQLCVQFPIMFTKKKLSFIEPLRKNASTTVVRLRPTAAVGIMNASETAALSQMSFVVKTQTSVPHHHLSVKGMIKIFIFLCCYILVLVLFC